MIAAPDRRPAVLVASRSADLAAELREILVAHVDVVDVAEVVEDQAARPDLVIADLEHAASLGAARRDLPLLVVVRRDSSAEVAAALEAGATDVLATPLEPGVVVARVSILARLSSSEAGLADRNAALAAWADRAGHDLTTPLAVISGMAETLEAAWDRLAEADRVRLLGSIRNQAAKALAMLDEAVALARDQPRPGPTDGPAVDFPS